MKDSITSHGSSFFFDDEADPNDLPWESQFNPLVIFNKDNKVLLIINPQGDVEILDQDGLRAWALETSMLMSKLNSPPEFNDDQSDE
jgi:hypothetical protein